MPHIAPMLDKVGWVDGGWGWGEDRGLVGGKGCRGFGGGGPAGVVAGASRS